MHRKKDLTCCECRRCFGAAETFYKHKCFHLRKQLRAFNASGRKSHGVNFYHCQLCAIPFTGGLEFEHHIKVTHPEQYRKATRRIFSAGMTRSKRSRAFKSQRQDCQPGRC
uniref:C2H2-type domain-containing protein n=1 Tax=Anguilla anguilla TaxID=7936 RepID=A0A0E9VNC8_ANGAN